MKRKLKRNREVMRVDFILYQRFGVGIISTLLCRVCVLNCTGCSVAQGAFTVLHKVLLQSCTRCFCSVAQDAFAVEAFFVVVRVRYIKYLSS